MRRFFFNSNNLNAYSLADNPIVGSSIADSPVANNLVTTETAGHNQPVALSQLAVDSNIALTEDIYHHWCRVLRAKVGDQSLIFDGLGGQSTIELEAIDKKSAQARIIAHDNIDNTSHFYSTIAIVMSRGDRMDYAIQKATELGATAIQLLTSHHGEVRLKANQVDKKLKHWQQVAVAACEQCGLNRPPLVLSPVSIEQWLQQRRRPLQNQVDNLVQDQVHSDITYLLNEAYYQHYFNQPTLPLVLAVPSQQERQQLNINLVIEKHFNSAYANKLKPRFDILIGAEGGLSELEYQQARKDDFLPWQLGNRVLRTETAPVVALSTLMYIGDSLY